MARFYDQLDEELAAWIPRQPVFFVATAAAAGRINLSPKGMDTLRVLDLSTVAWLDLTGSGNQTAVHLRHDGRLTMMLCSFDKAPRILRLYGRGEVLAPDDASFASAAAAFPPLPGVRQLIRLHVESVQTSCGYAVPLMDLVAERDTLARWAEREGPEGLAEYRAEHNAVGIDGLPNR